MNVIIRKILFHKSGKPRCWLMRLLFKKNMSIRSSFRKIAYKKNGHIRPRFKAFIREASKNSPEFNISNDFVREEEAILKSLPSLEKTVLSWRGKLDPKTLLSSDTLKDEITKLICKTERKILISFSNDHYRKVIGGVQLCIEHEEIQAQIEGFTYLNVHPWHALPRLAHLNEDPDIIISLVINGVDLGCSRMSTLISTISNLRDLRTEVVIHHMLGHQPEQILELVQASNSNSCIFWLHDFFSICPSYTLQRNKLSFCNAPPVESNACGLCVFGKERLDHLERMELFFSSTHVNVISPSENTAKLWKSRSNLRFSSLTVAPHIILEVESRVQKESIKIEDTVVIGYLGAPVRHKGWSIFSNLVSDFSGTGRYRFVVMSQKSPDINSVEWIKVSVSGEKPTAMSDAVKLYGVDLVLHWPTWPETFSFTTFEALAGNAYIITNPSSGNIADAVQETKKGVILNNENSLSEYLSSGAAIELAEKRRQNNMQYKINHKRSRMSFEILN